MLQYKELISEDVATLLACERQQKHSKLRDRVRMLRLLKSGEAVCLPQVAPLIGLSLSQVRKLFTQYRRYGLQEFVLWRYGGNRRKLTVAQQQHLVSVCTETPNRFSSQAAIGQYILQTFGVSYRQSGISMLCSRTKLKHKVGRPRNKQSSAEEQQAYKKNSARH